MLQTQPALGFGICPREQPEETIMLQTQRCRRRQDGSGIRTEETTMLQTQRCRPRQDGSGIRTEEITMLQTQPDLGFGICPREQPEEITMLQTQRCRPRQDGSGIRTEEITMLQTQHHYAIAKISAIKREGGAISICRGLSQ